MRAQQATGAGRALVRAQQAAGSRQHAGVAPGVTTSPGEGARRPGEASLACGVCWPGARRGSGALGASSCIYIPVSVFCSRERGNM